MKQAQYMAMQARKRAAGEPMNTKAAPLARRIAIQQAAREEARGDAMRDRAKGRA